jgi:hypothetical protein
MKAKRASGGKTKAKVIEMRSVSVQDVNLLRVTDDPQYREDLRFRFLSDHFFAAEALGFKSFIPHLHQPAVDLYFPKNPRVTIPEQHAIKNRMHLDPRHTFKTTLGKVDSAQWVAAFPELITILSEGATQPLAEAISTSVCKFFWQQPGKEPTLVQRLFPELVFCDKPGGKWDSPTHSALEMDKTLDFTSPLTSQSGWHPWIINPDDMVDTTNSGLRAKQERRQAVIDTYYTNKNLLRKGGYVNLRGTRYHPFDLYGDVLAKMNPAEWKVLVRGSMRVRSGQPLVPGDFPPEDDVELIFPELLSYTELREKFYESFESFMCQQQNDPQGGNVPTFPERIFDASLCNPDRIPPMGETIVCWRLPYGGKEYMAKYAEGAAARIYGDRVYILDAWQGVYLPSSMAEKVIRECKRYDASTLVMESLPGTEYLDIHIRNEGVRRNVSIRTQWMEFEEDDNIRIARIKQLEPQMQQGRIAISTGIGKIAEVKRQFVNFQLIEENGIIDTISRLASRLPMNILRQEIADEEAELHRRRREDAMHSMIFSHGGVAAVEDQKRREMLARANEYAMARTNELGLPEFFGLDG